MSMVRSNRAGVRQLRHYNRIFSTPGGEEAAFRDMSQQRKLSSDLSVTVLGDIGAMFRRENSAYESLSGTGVYFSFCGHVLLPFPLKHFQKFLRNFQYFHENLLEFLQKRAHIFVRMRNIYQWYQVSQCRPGWRMCSPCRQVRTWGHQSITVVMSTMADSNTYSHTSLVMWTLLLLSCWEMKLWISWECLFCRFRINQCH